MGKTLITNLAWGQMEVSVGEQTLHFKDCKLWPAGGREWIWDETGTHHSPGIQPGDIKEVLEQGVDVIILGCGQLGRLGVSPETRTLLEEQGIAYHIAKTKKAIALFNELAQAGKRVGGVFHSTC